MERQRVDDPSKVSLMQSWNTIGTAITAAGESPLAFAALIPILAFLAFSKFSRDHVAVRLSTFVSLVALLLFVFVTVWAGQAKISNSSEGAATTLDRTAEAPKMAVQDSHAVSTIELDGDANCVFGGGVNNNVNCSSSIR